VLIIGYAVLTTRFSDVDRPVNDVVTLQIRVKCSMYMKRFSSSAAHVIQKYIKGIG